MQRHRVFGQKLDSDIDPRLLEYRRLRLIAGLLLVGMTLVFIVASLLDRGSFLLGCVKAFAEAGMVGACADWFAVVALFRRPFGLPIPHTGVIPGNKSRIGGALGRFITTNFLAPRMAAERMAEIDVVALAADWLKKPDHMALITQYSRHQLPKFVKLLMSRELSDFVGKVAEYGIRALPAAPLASKALSILWANGQAQIVFDQAIDLAETALTQNRDMISTKVSEKSSKLIPKWVDVYIANRVVEGLIGTLNDARDPNHPWRLALATYVETLIVNLASNPDLREKGEQLKRDFMSSDIFKSQMAEFWSELESTRQSDVLTSRIDLMTDMIEFGVVRFAAWLQADPTRAKRLNRQLRLGILRVLLPLRFEIADYIAKAVDRWDDATMVKKLELQVGKDLQYIRINGTLVGGLVGLIIFLVSSLSVTVFK